MSDTAEMFSDPSTWFGGATRVLFVHAHPDDETIATGGTIAALNAVGRPAPVITLTRGEQGEVTQGPFAHLQGTAGLAPHREQELRAALLMLGVTDHAFLGSAPARHTGLPDRVYEDSGMEWGANGVAVAAAHTPETALTRVSAMEVINDLLYGALSLECDAIVSYDDAGGYGHPDHVLAHRAARAVAHAIEVPFWEIVTDASAETVEPVERAEAYDVSEWIDRKIGALRMHGTQLTVVSDEELEHVGGQRQPITRVERYRKLGDPAPRI